MSNKMNHEARQNFIHVEAKKLRESLNIEMDTPTSFFIVKEIIDNYDLQKSETLLICNHEWKVTNHGYTRDCLICGEKR
jgi:hypothetical protein